MQLEHTFTVPASLDEAFAVLTDIEQIAPCMPGASLDEVGEEEFSGQVKVRLGPMEVIYHGTARFTEQDPEAHRVTLEATGNQRQGGGTAQATVRAELAGGGEGTTVTVTTDLSVTGRPAQFGRGIMDDVGATLLGQFADCLAAELSGPPEAGQVPEPAAEARPSDDATSEDEPSEMEAADTEAADTDASEDEPSDSGTAEQEAPAADTGDEPSAPPEGGGAGAAGGIGMDRVEPPTETPGRGVGAVGTSRREGSPVTARASGPSADGTRRPGQPPEDAIDLLELAGPSVLRRYGPAALLVAVAAVLAWWAASSRR